MEEFTGSEFNTIRSSETPISSIRIMPISIRCSQTQEILTEILEKLPELSELCDKITCFHQISSSTTNYYGQINNSSKHGIGKEIYKSGIIYYGQFSNNKKNGLGYLSIPNKDNSNQYYKGNFVDEAFSGYGEYHCDRNYYKGEWQNDLKHGYGKEKIGKTYFRGHYLFGSKIGEGKLKIASGEFIGEFIDDKFCKGKFKDKTGKFEYSGSWEDKAPNGRGKIKFNSGTIRSFSGEFHKGNFGAGILRFPDGKKIVHKGSQ